MIKKESKEIMMEILRDKIRLELDSSFVRLNQAYRIEDDFVENINEAMKNIKEAISWYLNQLDRIGEDFKEAIEEAMKSIDRAVYFYKELEQVKEGDGMDGQ